MAMDNEFAHLHVHTAYSLLDGYSRIKELARAAREANMRALAITDHGNLYGGIEFYQACKAEGIKSILGVEAYLAEDVNVRAGKGIDYNHCLLIAENNTGYQNLLKLVSRSNIEGYYYKPRIDYKMLQEHHEGLVITTGCLAGTIPELLSQGKHEEATAHLTFLRETFGDKNVFLEVQDHQDSVEQTKLNAAMVRLARATGLPLLATNDLHYTYREDALAQDYALCVQMGKAFTDENRMKFGSDNYYLKPAAEMASLFHETPDALRNTITLAERCNVSITFGQDYLPVVEPPAPFKTGADYLYSMAEDGLRERYGEINDSLRDRFHYEFAIINEKGFVPYFLVVYDYVSWARRNGIRCVARGSVAGSVVAYALGFSNVDPLRYGLPFERFLNPERSSMPDIDIDFPDDKRALVIAYIANKYGWDHVAQIATFNVSAARAAVRDAGRVANLRSEADLVSRLLPKEPSMTLATAPMMSSDLATALSMNPKAKVVYDMARSLEGMTRSSGIHAAGLVISREPLMGLVPLQPRDRDGSSQWLVSQYDQHALEDLGLLKMDMLGLSNLSTLRRVVDMIRQTTGEVIDVDRLPLDDADTFTLLSEGDTTGVFQLESSGMRRYLKQLKPTRVEDVMAMVALYRPGPMDSIPTYIQAKNSSTVRYPHPSLKNILKDTYGTLVFQDQVLFAAIELAGYTWGEVDKFRKAMGKKIPAEIAAQRTKFINGCVANGLAPDDARAVFDLIEPFGGYAFNYGHAASYAMVAYQTAYLKVHYPAHFYAASMTTEAGDTAKLAFLVLEARQHGIAVLAPDVNGSAQDFTVVEHNGKFAIRFGLCALRGVGDAAVQGILAMRASQPISTIEEFFNRGKRITTATVETLVKAGALDSLYPDENRATLLSWVKPAASYARRVRTLKNAPKPNVYERLEGEPEDERRLWEFESMGVYLSSHPLDPVRDRILSVATHNAVELGPDVDGEEVTIAGRVVEVKKRTTKGEDKREMASLVVEDLSGTTKVILFPRQYARYGSGMRVGAIRVFHGRYADRDGDGQVLAERIELLPSRETLTPEMSQISVPSVFVTVPQTLLPTGVLTKITALFAEHIGQSPWKINMVNGPLSLTLSTSEAAEHQPIHYSETLQAELEQLGCGVTYK